jgi:hypothetical protein
VSGQYQLGALPPGLSLPTVSFDDPMTTLLTGVAESPILWVSIGLVIFGLYLGPSGRAKARKKAHVGGLEAGVLGLGAFAGGFLVGKYVNLPGG